MMIIFKEILAGDLDFHAFLDEVDGELFEGSQVFLDLFQNFFLLELAAPEHSDRVFGALVGHLKLAYPISEGLQEHLP